MGPATRSRAKISWPLAAAITALVWLAGAAVRVIEYRAWLRDDGLWWNAIPVLPSADAFAWLAGAEGLGRFVGWPLARLLAGLDAMTGAEAEWIAFWLPAVLAPLPGVLVAAMCMRWRQPLAAVVAGSFAAASIGYLARTRLGFLDTDLLALAALTALAWAWLEAARGLAQLTEEAAIAPRHRTVRVAVALTAGTLAVALYPSGYPVAVAIIAMGAAVSLARLPVRAWGQPLAAAAACVLALNFGAAGWIAGLAVWGGVQRLGDRTPVRVGAGLVLIAGSLIAVFDPGPVATAVDDVLAYTMRSGGGVSEWSMPDTSGSILEIAPVSVSEWMLRVAGHPALLVLGLTGFSILLFRRPESAAFLPLLGLGLGSLVLGHRFAMYAAPVIGLGLGPGLALLAERAFRSRQLQVSAQLLMLAAVAAVIAPRALEMRPSPALSQKHVQALTELDDAYDHGRIWTWWDTGYAAHYYARIPPIADGGSASRARIYALALVLGARSPSAAAAIVASAASRNPGNRSPARDPKFDPLGFLEGLDASTAQSRINRLLLEPGASPSLETNEFLVVSWSSLRQAGWIGRFADWRLDRGDPGFDRITLIAPPVRLRENDGVLVTPRGPVALRSIDILDQGDRFHRTWDSDNGMHAVINNSNGEGVLMDTPLYRMMLVQMLIGDPDSFSESFELVSDQFPTARIYRVR